jgi:glycine cleavage system aminomethyltransferase T
MVKLDLKGYGLKAPPRLKNACEWNLGQEHYLVTCLPDMEQNVLAQVRAFPAPQDLLLTPPVYATDVTSVYAQFLLAGPQSRNVLRKLTSLNAAALANLAGGQASVAHVPGMILRDDIADIPAFHLLVSREYGESVWDAILHAGHEFHIAPCGLKALEFLGGRV